MKRRSFLKSSGTALAATLAPRALMAKSAAAAAAWPRSLPLSRGWRFAASDVGGAEQPGFDDRAFTPVVLPHTNVALPWHGFDDKLYEFVSTYRRSFRLPASMRRQRVFVDFEGAMTASTVWINGVALGEYRGGYTPFSFELTPHLQWGRSNVLTVKLDSRERADIPPFGNEIDYMTFGGIYREASLRVVPPLFIDDVRVRAAGLLTAAPSLDVDCWLAGPASAAGVSHTLRVQLMDGDREVARAEASADAAVLHAAQGGPAAGSTPAPVWLSSGETGDPACTTVRFSAWPQVELWDLEHPRLYTVRTTLLRDGTEVDRFALRTGFRQAEFTPRGFELNGKHLKLRGLDRHQTFPYAGGAMGRRVQAHDAEILKRELHCNIVRTSHYPQSRHFLDRCDEVGLLLLEEIPGWQHMGPQAWKELAVDNVRRMVMRDRHHPSVVLWGTRINESGDDDAFYTRTNALAHALDPTRQTGGIRNFMSSHLIEDVFTINDFGIPLQPPNHPLYLNTEFVGHTFPTKSIDNNAIQREDTLRHARIHNQLASSVGYAGGMGWCAFDYNTHGNFGAGDRICYHGVMDIFRLPKRAAGFYRSQCDPAEEVVLEPAFQWARGDEPTQFTDAVVCSNCDTLRWYLRPMGEPENSWHLMAETAPDREQFAYLPHAPFVLDLSKLKLHQFSQPWGDLRLDGIVGGKVAISRTYSGDGVERRFEAYADSPTLVADSVDATRVVLRVTDPYGAVFVYANDPIQLTLDGPAELIGDPIVTLMGGVCAVWVRTRETPGTVTLVARHPRLGTQTVRLAVQPRDRDTVEV